MPKFIVDIDDGIDVANALHKLSMVVARGRASEAAGIKHYTWLTRWNTGLLILSRRKKKGQTSDSFLIQQEKPDA